MLARSEAPLTRGVRLSPHLTSRSSSCAALSTRRRRACLS
ncbi:hypothetical protein C884_02082 [Kocuria palustris PEL]|uniref:Uncharacterized protein n=1 Tax=Kocuria palustris PEL TaxID=1236550 RepID=M2XWH5_9MICC|nr:hypothetical protein C884_02082 [Kocuria palustris PEL]